MTAATALWVVVGGMLGAPLRYALDRAVQRRTSGRLPWGTFAVNVLGSLLLGGLVAAGPHLPAAADAALGIGLAGALTTYSTFGYETWRLFEDGARLPAAVNAVGSVLATAGAAAAGFLAAAALFG